MNWAGLAGGTTERRLFATGPRVLTKTRCCVTPVGSAPVFFVSASVVLFLRDFEGGLGRVSLAHGHALVFGFIACLFARMSLFPFFLFFLSLFCRARFLARLTVLSSAFPLAQVKSISPLSRRVLVRPREAETKTAGGILLPSTAQKKPTVGEIVDAGTATTLKV